jgi:L-aspartate oxidase
MGQQLSATNSERNRPKVTIIGSGIAGLSSALHFAEFSHVTLLTKREAEEGATRYAQGGIASVWSKTDSFEEHIQDTLTAGAGLCQEAAVQLCVREGPARVQELIQWGVEFTKAAKKAEKHDAHISAEATPRSPASSQIETVDPTEVYDLHREGGHGKRRILHADDLTGWAIERALLARVRANPNIQLLENQIVVDLITEGKLLKRWLKPGKCIGAYVLDSNTGEIRELPADITVIATGGAGKVYLYTSNPDTSTGDGIAMAYRAGARVANLEFMQFHPTCLFHPNAQTFLITEALRGEGAILRNQANEDFMKDHHPLGSLAPRDIVARAIDMELKRSGAKHLWLDCSAIPGEKLKSHFPHIYETCAKMGIWIDRQPIPVVPACHYTCGGVLTDENAQTSIPGLYAVGEAACTGLHGANRLASNSLLEAVVYAHRAARHAQKNLGPKLNPNQSSESNTPLPQRSKETSPLANPLPKWDAGQAEPIEEKIDIAATWLEIRSLMWNYVGIVRSNRRLERAKRRLELIKAEVNAYYWSRVLTPDLIELRNLLTVAELIVNCASLRKESRGLHYTVDYPETDDFFFKRDTVL